MPEARLVDTNIVVYSYDPSDPIKQATAQALIQQLIDEDGFVVSAQVLNEFYRAATRVNRPPSLSHNEAEKRIRFVVRTAREVLPLTSNVTLRAMDGIASHGLSFWDAILWATAEENGIPVIYTEDMPGAPVIGRVQYINPFDM
jgi:predicted nucleic acid-binding protein